MADFLLCAVLLLVAIASFGEAQTVNAYFKVGGTLVLRPDKVTAPPITSIVWKYDKNLLAEWVQGSIPLTYYSRFNGRSSLTTANGTLEIRDTTVDDSVVYSVEINNQVQSKVYQGVAIEDVPQPKVEFQPLVCNSASGSCKLACLGDVSKAGPVEYFWKEDDGEWKKSEKNTKDIINDKETQRVERFSCRMKNPVSEKDSKPFDNIFHQNEEPEPPSSSSGGLIAGIIVGIIVITLMVVGVVGYMKKESVIHFFEARRRQPVPPSDNGVPGTTATDPLNMTPVKPETA